jgi:drug/metabolite transporter (DMT)-like permease
MADPETDLYELDPRPWCSYVTRSGALCLGVAVPGDTRCGLHGGRRSTPRTNRRAGAPGDWMGLLAGIVWAATMVFFLPAAGQTAFDRVLAQFVFLGPVYLLVSMLPGAGAAVATLSHSALPLAWLLTFSLVWMLPAVWLTIFGASRLEPGRAAVLFMLEIAVALVSAALLAAEPFGMSEALGAALITGAGGVELIPHPAPRSRV